MAEWQRVVRTIPASFTKSVSSFARVINVGAYARVSTKKEEQEDSYERQVNHYTNYIKHHEGWNYVDIYADEGITGTRAEGRKDFQRMMADCRLGKLDKILVKSIARFARNTVDALNAIRELKELGVSVYFENENIDTLSPGGEVLITILAAMAEQESRTISSNIKWAYQKKFQNGDILLNYTRFLGYTRDEDHNLVIVPEEAQVVQRIFREYLYGYSMAQIAKGLTEDKIPTPSKKKKWYPSVIQSILQNEKYYGGLICGKTYKPDVLSKKRYKNEGQVERYYIENSHPAIVTREEFEMAQAELRRRKTISGSSATEQGKYSSKYAFSKKLMCGVCGAYYRRHAQYCKGEYIYTWVCPTHKLKGSDVCKQTYLKETEIEQAFVDLLESMVGDYDTISAQLKENILSSMDEDVSEELTRTMEDIERLQIEMLELLRRKRKGEIDTKEYNERGAILERQIQSLTEKRAALEEKSTASKLAIMRVDQVMQALQSAGNIEKNNGELFRAMVDVVVVRNTYTLEFHLKAGITESVTIQR